MKQPLAFLASTPLALTLSSSPRNLTSRRPAPPRAALGPATGVAAGAVLALTGAAAYIILRARRGRRVAEEDATAFSARGAEAKSEREVPERLNLAQELDKMAERATAQIDGERIRFASGGGMDGAAYEALSGVQRRELLAMALRERSPTPVAADDVFVDVSGPRAVLATAASLRGEVVPKKVVVAKESKGPVAVKRGGGWRRISSGYWKAAESWNGRAAALGFVLCLAREVVEPGHPTLFDQVEDVLLPIATHAPPFVVAMCDRIVDLVL